MKEKLLVKSMGGKLDPWIKKWKQKMPFIYIQKTFFFHILPFNILHSISHVDFYYFDISCFFLFTKKCFWINNLSLKKLKDNKKTTLHFFFVIKSLEFQLNQPGLILIFTPGDKANKNYNHRAHISVSMRMF